MSSSGLPFFLHGSFRGETPIWVAYVIASKRIGSIGQHEHDNLYYDDSLEKGDHIGLCASGTHAQTEPAFIRRTRCANRRGRKAARTSGTGPGGQWRKTRNHGERCSIGSRSHKLTFNGLLHSSSYRSSHTMSIRCSLCSIISHNLACPSHQLLQNNSKRTTQRPAPQHPPPHGTP